MSSLSEAVPIPIPKNKNKPLNDSKNYRAIAMSSALGKVLDLCMLAKHGNTLEMADLQFGFKRDHSATQWGKQGGILSPILFTVYVNALFLDFAKCCIGGHVGHKFYGRFCICR